MVATFLDWRIFSRGGYHENVVFILLPGSYAMCSVVKQPWLTYMTKFFIEKKEEPPELFGYCGLPVQ